MSFSNLVKTALKYINIKARNGNRVAQQTIHILKKNNVKIQPYSKAKRIPLNNMLIDVRYMQEDSSINKISELNKHLYGYQYGNTIFLSNELSIGEMENTIVHETIHILDKCIGNLGNEVNIYKDEMSARIAEEIYKETKLTRSLIKSIEKDVYEIYKCDRRKSFNIYSKDLFSKIVKKLTS